MAKKADPSGKKNSAKMNDLAPDIETGADQLMTTDQGLKINDDQNSLKSGERGPYPAGRFYSPGKNYPF